jgi:hypothetical protein
MVRQTRTGGTSLVARRDDVYSNQLEKKVAVRGGGRDGEFPSTTYFSWRFYIFKKGLVAACHSFCIYFSLYNTVDVHSYNHTSFIHKHSLRPISISSQLSARWAEPPWVPSRDSNSGLPYSKTAQYQLSQAAPYKPRCTLKATLHPKDTLHPIFNDDITVALYSSVIYFIVNK